MTCFLSEGHGTLQLDLNFFTSLQKMIPDASFSQAHFITSLQKTIPDAS